MRRGRCTTFLTAATVSSVIPVATPPLGRYLVSIAVTPATPTIAVSGTQQMTATGTYSDASTVDLTNSVVWSSSDPTKITISATGLATWVAAGTSTITATAGTISGNTLATAASSFTSVLAADGNAILHLAVNSGVLKEQFGKTVTPVGAPTFNALAAIGFPNNPSAESVGAFTDANYFTLGAGGNNIDLAAGDFIITVIESGGQNSRYLFQKGDNNSATGGWLFWGVFGPTWSHGSTSTVFIQPFAFTGPGGQQYTISSVGFDSATGHLWYKRDNAAPVDVGGGYVNPVNAAGYTAMVGRGQFANGFWTPGNLVEVLMTTTKPTAAVLNAIHAQLGL